MYSFFPPKKLVVLSKSSEEPNRYKISGTYYIGYFLLCKELGKISHRLEGERKLQQVCQNSEVLGIFDIKLSICNFSLGFSEILDHNEFR